MNKQDVIGRLKQNAEELKARGVVALYLFGSLSRDEAVETSDIDLFIDSEPTERFSLLDLVNLHQHLETALGARVDLTTRDSLHPMLRREIEQSAIQVF